MQEINKVLDAERLDKYVEVIQDQNARTDRLDGWFLAREIMMEHLEENGGAQSEAMTQALLLDAVVERLPLSIRDGEIFAGTEDDAFARSYALINPDFKIDSFEGYCDENAVYGDIEPGGVITQERIDRVRDFWGSQPFAEKISEVYESAGGDTREVVYFVERVTGHTIPDFRDALERGVDALIAEAGERAVNDPAHTDYYQAIKLALGCAVKLARRYSGIAAAMAARESDATRKAELQLIAETCARVPARPAANLYEAIQSYIILWQVMNLEQSPNPFAFSAGNMDRILQPYYEKSGIERALAVQLVRHLLAFFCVGDRNWAISQNIMVGGMDENGADLTCDMSYIIMDAFALSNYSQPNLSVKIHPGTPDEFYRKIAEFMFEFGHSTPSFFSDPVIFDAMRTKGIREEHLPLYGIAGCQEPLVMGKESANTTNSWLNLAKILELAITDGVSLVTGERLGPRPEEIGVESGTAGAGSAAGIKDLFYKYLEYYVERMRTAANGCTEALALLPVPFKSAFMGGRETGADMRSVSEQGTSYNGSGCLIHGLANVADSFSAVSFIEEEGGSYGVSVSDLLEAVRQDYAGGEEIRDIVLRLAPKYGNNNRRADAEAVELQERVSRIVNSLKNPLGRNFCADWSTPSTNLLYGHWTGATPDGRRSRKALNYGIDPAVEAGRKGLLARIASQSKLNYALMSGGSAVALSINPDPLDGKSAADKARHLKVIVSAVFGFNEPAPTLMYAYFNVFSAKKLFDVMEHPGNYPEPVLVRIHGQYGDARHLSPDILEKDIIPRLDPMSASF